MTINSIGHRIIIFLLFRLATFSSIYVCIFCGLSKYLLENPRADSVVMKSQKSFTEISLNLRRENSTFYRNLSKVVSMSIVCELVKLAYT